MKRLKKIINELNQDIICGSGTVIFIQEIEGLELDGLGGIVNSKYKLGVLGENNIFVDLSIKTNDMNLYDNRRNILINLSDFGYRPIDFSEDILY